MSAVKITQIIKASNKERALYEYIKLLAKLGAKKSEIRQERDTL